MKEETKEKKEPTFLGNEVIEAEDLSKYTEEDLKHTYIELNKQFKEKVDKIDSKEELEKLEEEAIALFDKHEEHIQNVKYALPKSIELDGKRHVKSAILKSVSSFLKRHSVKFQYVYGMYNACKFWESSPEEVNYKMLDGTLRMLEQLEYKGSDWEEIIKVSLFFNKVNDEYSKDMSRTLFIADRHNIILERMQLVCPTPNQESAE